MPSADLLWRRISVLTATVPKFANHTCGSAVDVSILHRGTGRELDRGGPYLDLSERTPMDSPFISREARRNRGLINRIFAEHGFLAYPYEFWHYSHGDADHALLSGLNTPAVYGPVDLDLDTGHVTTFPTPLEPLLTLDHVAAFLERRQQAGAS
jgi:D-alanyl-D-alanine dipeptidase